MTGFRELFAAADQIIMRTLGDDITLTPPTGGAINTKCQLATRSGTKQRAAIEWLDNIIAKVDINSVIVEVLAVDAQDLGKNWTALYLGETYDVSEVLPRGDGTLVVILNKPGNTMATANGWK